MRIQELMDFYKLSNYNSFTSAADDLYTSRYNLMRNITNIENDLGVKLFNRRNNGIYLTEVGKEMLAEASAIIEHYENMLAIANNMKGSKPVVRVGCYANNSTTYAMLNVINLFNAAQNDYTAEFVSVDQKSLLTMLKDDEVDFAFTIIESTNDIYRSYPIYKRVFYALVNHESKLASKEHVSKEDILHSNLVVPQLTGGTERILVRNFGSSISKNIVIRSNDFYYLYSYISHNRDCIGIFNNEDSKSAERVFDNLVAIPIKPSMYAELCLLAMNTKGKAIMKNRFVEFVVNNYNKVLT